MEAANLYCNVGAVSLGMQNAGWDVKFGAQSCTWPMDTYFDEEPYVQTYEANFEHPFVKAYGLEGEVPSGTFPVEEVDWAHGSPPCTGFSMANNEREVVFRPENSDTVFFIKQASSLNPKVITLENVSGMKTILDSHPDIADELGHDKWMNFLVQEFKDWGYDMKWQQLNAADYGAPQKRHRIICVGVREDLPHPEQWHPDPTHSEDGEELPRWRSQDDAFNDLPNAFRDHDVPNHVPPKHERFTIERYAMMKHPDDGGAGFHPPDEPGLTLMTKPNLHPRRARKMTVREMARLMTLPDDFVLKGKRWMQCEVGTTIPALFAQRMAEHVEEMLVAIEAK